MTGARKIIRSVIHRLAGRDGMGPPGGHAEQARKVNEQARKARDAQSVVRESRMAVDSFTTAVERAMRGNRT